MALGRSEIVAVALVAVMECLASQTFSFYITKKAPQFPKSRARQILQVPTSYLPYCKVPYLRQS